MAMAMHVSVVSTPVYLFLWSRAGVRPSTVFRRHDDSWQAASEDGCRAVRLALLLLKGMSIAVNSSLASWFEVRIWE